MVMQPKFSFDKSKRKFVALKEFTDREQPQETFERNIIQLSENLANENEENQVLVYYGVGGIGKTTLKNKLKEKVFDMSNAVALEIDFKNVRSRGGASGLLELSNSAKLNINIKTIKFPHFELAYAIYFKKKNPDYSFSIDNESIFEKFDIGIEILSALDPIGLVDISKKLMDKIYSQSKKWKLDKEIKEHLHEFVNLPLNEMESWLPTYFAYDLKKYIHKNNNIKIVIFMDTFEALNDYETHELKKLAKQEWIQELIKNLPNVLFTILGREKIAWETEWNKYLDQHLLSELTAEYTNKFLKNCGIVEEEIRKKIALVSNGHPYYLDLSVDTYFSIKNNGDVPSCECFGNEKKDILERFIQNLNSVEIEVLKIMSIPTYYDFEIFSLLIDKFNIPYPPTQLNSFNQYSFITKNESYNRYYIHQLMRDGMNEYIDNNLKIKVNQVLFDYFEIKYSNNKRDYLFECVYHKLNLSTKEEFFKWAIDTKLNFFKHLQLYGETLLLSNVFNAIGKKYEITQFNIKLFNIYEDMVHLSGSYKESVRISEMFLSNFSEKEIFSRKDLIKLKFRIVHHKMFYVNADELILELIEIKDKITKNNFFEEYCEVIYMLGGGVGFLTGNLEKSKQYLDSLINIIDKNSFKTDELENIYLRAIRKIIDYNRVLGNIDTAQSICDKYLKEDRLNRYQLYLLCSYGEILRKKSQIDAAQNCFEKVLNSTKALGIRGWVAHAYLSLANIEIDLFNYSRAKNFIDSAKLIYNEISQQWGIINANIMISRIMIKENEQYAIKLLEETKIIAEQYSYRYEMELINNIVKTKNIGEQQLLYV